MGLLRRWITRLMGRDLIEAFFAAEDRAARAELFHQRWENVWWLLFTKVLLSRATMSLLFDKGFFAHLGKSFSFGKHFAKKAERALTEFPTKENYFLSYILLGKYYDEERLPPYLRRENYATIRDRVDRIETVCDNCEHFFTSLPDETISRFNFTNIFEWMSPEAYERLLKETIRVARDGAIMTYRNLLVFRERPLSLQAFVHPHRARARLLHEQDLSFIYNNYVVEEIHKRGNECHTRSEQHVAVGR
jgi:S-adenosylmethionine-diacylglycerol 3-amino-3-carboxypropyl transferase